MIEYESNRVADRRCERVVERRRSLRWPVNKRIAWCVHRGRRVRVSRMSVRSLHGLAMVTSLRDTPALGTRFRPGDESLNDEYGFRLAVVRRVGVLTANLRFVFAEIEA
jgi:hypothetical protein